MNRDIKINRELEKAIKVMSDRVCIDKSLFNSKSEDSNSKECFKVHSIALAALKTVEWIVTLGYMIETHIILDKFQELRRQNETI